MSFLLGLLRPPSDSKIDSGWFTSIYRLNSATNLPCGLNLFDSLFTISINFLLSVNKPRHKDSVRNFITMLLTVFETFLKLAFYVICFMLVFAMFAMAPHRLLFLHLLFLPPGIPLEKWSQCRWREEDLDAWIIMASQCLISVINLSRAQTGSAT